MLIGVILGVILTPPHLQPSMTSDVQKADLAKWKRNQTKLAHKPDECDGESV
jgi:hypothetical protein